MPGEHLAPDPGELRRAQAEHLALDGDPDAGLVDAQHRQVHQPLQHGHHSQAALDHRGRGRVDPGRGQPQRVDGDATDRTQGHRVLAEGRQHPLDVVHEQRRRSDHQDPAALEAAAIGVQEVRRAVQRDNGLAGARPAGDGGDAGVVGADRLVLLGLDGGDDVAHPRPPGTLQRGHQRALADDHQLVVGVRLEQVVLDADDDVVAAAQHAPADDVHRVGRGGAVERFGGSGPPVDHQRLVVVVADADPADVADLAVGVVEAAEDQALVFCVEFGEPAGRLEGEGVPLEQRRPVLLAQPRLAVGAVDLPSRGGDFAG